MARVSSGKKSKQDYATPNPVIDGLVRKYGPILFDLAAEPHNKKHVRYFAPPQKIIGYTEDDDEITEPNVDPVAVALDAFLQDWAALNKKYGSGFLWLNPPFKNIEPWAEKFRLEAKRGANGMFLVPAAVGSNWYLDQVWRPKSADTIFLNGRLPFMGPGQPAYNKDCMVCHFWPGATGRTLLWDWRKDVWYEPEESGAAYMLEGRYVPIDADPYDDGNRTRAFDRTHFSSEKEAVDYMKQVTGGNFGAVVSVKLMEVKKKEVPWRLWTP